MRWLVILLCAAGPAWADMIVPAHTIRAKTIITEADLVKRQKSFSGALDDLSEIIGKETRVALYAGRPIRASDLRPAAIIERNQIVKLSYTAGSLSITADARALDRAAPGETIKVMNRSSRTTLFALVLPDGTLTVE
ncbi:MAG: flagellar basal body P-ring formation protein FlgA [Spiribacter salinus]|uniref:Flagella basal body P-ring formation protein FlgA n=2 Tax=Pseudomonadota TaxID=1224 RepID=A0A540VVP3_9GAMM|nr:MAG: flagellar basal body P-ring formation protein FlgA [Spiribacter salinus]